MFGAYGDLQFTSNEVLAYQTGHDDTEAFKKMLNMNKYVILQILVKLYLLISTVHTLLKFPRCVLYKRDFADSCFYKNRGIIQLYF